MNALSEAAQCTDGGVAVAELSAAAATDGEPVALTLTLQSGSEMPVRIMADGDSRSLHLTKTPVAGSYVVTVTAHAETATTDVSLNIDVTCPDVSGASSMTLIEADLKLMGFDADSLNVAGADHDALTSAIARGLGVPVGSVLDVSAAPHSDATGDSAVVSVAVEVPVEDLPSDRRVSLVIDSSTVADSEIAEQRHLAFAHAARLLSRSVGVCCTATFSEE